MNKQYGYVVLVCLYILAIIGNFTSLPLFFGVDLIFGSIFVFIILLFFGFKHAIGAVILSSLITIILWGHPYAFIIFSLEAIFVGWMYTRSKRSIILYDVIYWFFIGMPLIWLFYSFVMNMTTQQALLILLKQPINGLLNIMLACLLFAILIIRKNSEEVFYSRKVSLQQLGFLFFTLSTLLSLIIYIVIESRVYLQNVQVTLKEELYETSELVKNQIDHFFNYQLNQEIMYRDLVSLLYPINVTYHLDSKEKSILILQHEENASIEEILVNDHYNVEPLTDGVLFVSPSNTLPIMTQWRMSYYIYDTPIIENENYRFYTYIPLSPYIIDLQQYYIRTMFIILILLLLYSAVANMLISRLSNIFEKVAEKSRNFPDKLLRKEKTDWPKSNIIEAHDLIENFREMESVLNRQVSELKQAKDLLEKKVSERTLELEINRDKAVKASKAKTDFLSTMSHEIRTPMNAILGMSQLIGDSNLTLEQRNYLEILQRSSEHLLTIINSVLDLAKIESEQMKLEAVSFDIRELVTSTVKMFIHSAEKKGIQLSYIIDDKIAKEYIGDPFRISQILINLIGNSIKFTTEGYILIHLRKNESKRTGNILISVTDTGIGINKSKMVHLFNEFIQIDTSTTRRFGGTGLGLTISERLVKKMGGEIWVRSQEGKGSTFLFTVNIPKSKNVTKPVQYTEMRAVLHDSFQISNTNELVVEPKLIQQVEKTTDPITNKRILLVEDIEDNQLLMLAYLKKNAVCDRHRKKWSRSS